MSWEEAFDIMTKANDKAMVKILKYDIEEHCLKCESSMTMFVKKLMRIVPVGCERCSLYKYKRMRESVEFNKNAQGFLS